MKKQRISQQYQRKVFTVRIFDEDDRWLSNHVQFKYNKNVDKMSIINIFHYNENFITLATNRINYVDKKKKKKIKELEIKIKELMKKNPIINAKEIANRLKCTVYKVRGIYMKIRRKSNIKK